MGFNDSFITTNNNYKLLVVFFFVLCGLVTRQKNRTKPAVLVYSDL